MHYDEKVYYRHSTTVCRSDDSYEFKDATNDSTKLSRSRTIRDWHYCQRRDLRSQLPLRARVHQRYSATTTTDLHRLK
eukprot:1791040-Amphidinium_carterae.1